MIGLVDATDMEIFRFARENDLAVVTFDSDFIDLNAIHGMPPKFIYLNTGNLSTNNVATLLVDNALRITHYLHSDTDEILEIVK